MKSLESFMLALIAFLAPIQAILLTTLALVVVDLLTGVLGSLKQGKPITSYGLKRTVIKLLVYELALVLAYVVNQYLTGPSIPVLHLASSLIGLTELKSVYENINTISGSDLLSSLLSSIQGLSSNTESSITSSETDKPSNPNGPTP